jgi:hypothetical protein
MVKLRTLLLGLVLSPCLHAQTGTPVPTPARTFGPDIVLTFHVLNARTGKPMDARFFKPACFTNHNTTTGSCVSVRHLESDSEARHGTIKLRVPDDAHLSDDQSHFLSVCTYKPGLMGPDLDIHAKEVQQKGLIFNQQCEVRIPPSAAALIPKPGEVTIIYRRLSLYERIYANMW